MRGAARPAGAKTPRKRAQVFYFQPPVRPFCGSCAVVNRYLNETLEELGYTVDGIYGDGLRNASPSDFFVPLQAVARVRRERLLPPAALSVHCDFGLHVVPPRRRGAQKNVVLFHGLAGAPTLWAGNPGIDRYWGNSPYLAEVVCSLLAQPSWRRRTILDPRAFAAVSHLRLALPCLEEPDGTIQQGEVELPWRVREAIDGGDLLGHAVTPEKIDEPAFYSIVLLLNRLAQERGLGRRFRVFIAAGQLARVEEALALPEDRLPAPLRAPRAHLLALGLRPADLFIPVPPLAQSALFALLRACRFGLFYNVYAEAFGFYPLESVYHGCPVYTNGCGNLRHLLPPEHGIQVDESEAMGFGDLEAFLPVAEAIYRDTVIAPAAARERCRRGAAYLAAQHGREAFRQDVAAELERLASPPARTPFDALAVRLSPLVRRWNPATGAVLSDHSPRRLNADEREVAMAALGRRTGEILRSARKAEIEILQRLCDAGVLALAPSDRPELRPAPSPRGAEA